MNNDVDEWHFIFTINERHEDGNNYIIHTINGPNENEELKLSMSDDSITVVKDHDGKTLVYVNGEEFSGTLCSSDERIEIEFKKSVATFIWCYHKNGPLATMINMDDNSISIFYDDQANEITEDAFEKKYGQEFEKILDAGFAEFESRVDSSPTIESTTTQTPQFVEHYGDCDSKNIKMPNQIQIRIEQDIIFNNTKGILLHLDVSIENYKGKKCTILVCPIDDDGDVLYDYYGRYCDKDGNVCFTMDFFPDSDFYCLRDKELFIPYYYISDFYEDDENILKVSLIDDIGDEIITTETSCRWNESQYDCSIWCEKNVCKDKNIGIVFHAEFEVFDMKGIQGMICLYLYDENYEIIKDSDGNSICISETFVPQYEDCLFKDYQLFVPYSLLKGYPNFHFYQIWIYNNRNSNCIIQSEYYEVDFGEDIIRKTLEFHPKEKNRNDILEIINDCLGFHGSACVTENKKIMCDAKMLQRKMFDKYGITLNGNLKKCNTYADVINKVLEMSY